MGFSENSRHFTQLHGMQTPTLSSASRYFSLPGFSIASTGSYLPDRIVSNEELNALGCDSQWIIERTGIQARRWASKEQACSDLALQAALNCLSKVDIKPSTVDLIVVATITPDHFTPSTACVLQEKLKCSGPAMDLNAACTGFLYALVTAGQYVANGFAQRALVIGSEVMSRTVDPADPKSFPLFGDGAGAVLLVPTQPQKGSGLITFNLGADGSGASLLCIPAGASREPLTTENIEQRRQYLKMEGPTVFKWAVRTVEESIRDAIASANLTIDQIDHFVLHQANGRILDAAMQKLGIPKEKVYLQLDQVGNTSAASVPLALDGAVSDGRIQRGDTILLCGFGAGLTWGTAILKY